MAIEIDLSLVPTTLDAVHIGLGALSLVLLVIMLVVSTKNGASKSAAEPKSEPPAPNRWKV